MRILRHVRQGLRVAFVCALLLACIFVMSGCHQNIYFCDNGKTIEARYQMNGNSPTAVAFDRNDP